MEPEKAREMLLNWRKTPVPMLDEAVSTVLAECDRLKSELRRNTTAQADLIQCERCGKLILGAVVWLELDQRDNTYHARNDVPEALSQGWFPFGKDCAATIKRLHGRNK